MLSIPIDYAIIEDNIDIEVDSILNSNTNVILNLVKEKNNGTDTLTIKWTQVVKLLKERKIRYIMFEPTNASTIAISSIGSLNKSIGSAFMDLPEQKCVILLFIYDFMLSNEGKREKELMCYFEWVPLGAPFRDHILHGVYTGSYFQHWRDKIFQISDVSLDKRMMRRFPGKNDINLSKDEYLIKKARIISEYTWPEMRSIYLVYYHLLPLQIIPSELFEIIITFAFLAS